VWLRVAALVTIVLAVTALPVAHIVNVHQLMRLRGLSSVTYATAVGDGVIIVGVGYDGNVVCLKVSYGLSVVWSRTLGKGKAIASLSPEGKYLALGVVSNALTNVTIMDTRDGSVLRSFTARESVSSIKWVNGEYLALIFKEKKTGYWELSVHNLNGGTVFTTSSLGSSFRLEQALTSRMAVIVLNSSLSPSGCNAYAYVVGQGTRYIGGDVIALALSPDGSLVAMLQRYGNETRLEVKQVTDGSVVLNEALGDVGEGAVSFSDDGHYVAVAYVCGDGELLEVFSLSDGSLALRTKVLEGEPLVDFISWSPDSRYLLVRGAKGLEVLNLDGEVILSKVIIGDVDEVYWFPSSGSVGLVVEDETMGYDYFMLLSLSSGVEFKVVNGGVIGEYFLTKTHVLGLVFKDGTADLVFGNGSVIKVAGPKNWLAEHLLLREYSSGAIQAILLYSSGKALSLGEILISTAHSPKSIIQRNTSACNAVSAEVFAWLTVAVVIAAIVFLKLSKRR